MGGYYAGADADADVDAGAGAGAYWLLMSLRFGPTGTKIVCFASCCY